jgi:hypothetical protein
VGAAFFNHFCQGAVGDEQQTAQADRRQVSALDRAAQLSDCEADPGGTVTQRQ